MAEIDEIKNIIVEMQKQLDIVNEKYNINIKLMDSSFVSTKKLSKATDEYVQILNDTRKSEKDKVNDVVQAYKKQIRELNNELIQRKITNEQYVKQVDETSKVLQKLGNESGLSFSDLTVGIKDANNAQITGTNTYKYGVKSVQLFGAGVNFLTNGPLKFLTSSVSTLQGSQDSLSFALESGVIATNAISSGLKFLSNNAISGAVALSFLGPEASAAVLALGGFAGAAGEVFGFISSNIMPILNKQITMLNDAFKNSASTGALFVGGLTEMKNSAHEAGLTTADFGKLIKDNSESLALFGGDVAGGAKRISDVTKQLQRNLGKDYQDVFLKLGYSIEEIPGIIAKVGGDLSRGVGGASNEQVAQAVASYAKNLTLIADLTGKNAKDLQAKADAELKDLKLKQYINGFAPEQRELVKQQIAALDPATLQLFKERVAGYGEITSVSGGIMAETVPALGESSKEIYNLLENVKSGNQTLGTGILDISQKFSKDAQTQINSQQASALASASMINGTAAETVGKLADSYDQISQQANRGQAEYEAARAKIIEAMNTSDGKLQALIDLQKTGLEGRQKLEDAATDHIKEYGEVVVQLDGVTRGLIGAFGGLLDLALGRSSRNPNIATSAQLQSSGLGQEEANRRLRELNRQNDARATNPFIQPTIPTAPAGTPEFGTPEYYRMTHPDEDIGEHARGGVVSGPVSGYMAKLHGEEAVIPLPDGVSGPEFAQAIQGLARSGSIVGDTATATSQMRDQLSNLSNDLLTSLNSKIDDLISATVDVARYTKETSMGVR